MRYNDKRLLIMIGVGLVGVIYLKGKAEKAAEEVVDAVNPLSQENIFYKASNDVFHALGGNQHDTIGTWLHGVLN